MIRRGALLLAALVLASGCATTGGGGWQDVPATPVTHRYAPCAITLPAGWIFLQTRQGDQGDLLIATRRGVSLQSIRLTRRENAEAFPAVDRGAAPDTPSEELARRYIEDTASRFELDVVDVMDSRPARLGGVDGFRVHLAYRVAELRYQAVAQGISTSGGFFLLSYHAPTLHYFDADLQAFEQAVRSFTLTVSP